MGGIDLINELQAKTKQLETSLKLLRKNGIELAQAERDYKVLLNTECLKLRDEGMAVGMIDKISYGIPSVAEARFKRDCAEVVYTANKEAINVYKLQARIIENQISRDWGRGE